MNGVEPKDNDCDDESSMSSNLSPLSTEEDFASSIFSQLPTDLQHMLGLGDKQGRAMYLCMCVCVCMGRLRCMCVCVQTCV